MGNVITSVRKCLLLEGSMDFHRNSFEVSVRKVRQTFCQFTAQELPARKPFKANYCAHVKYATHLFSILHYISAYNILVITLMKKIQFI